MLYIKIFQSLLMYSIGDWTLSGFPIGEPCYGFKSFPFVVTKKKKKKNLWKLLSKSL